MTGHRVTHRFGFCLPAQPGGVALVVGVEEYLELQAAAGGPLLPLPRLVNRSGKPTVICHAPVPPSVDCQCLDGFGYQA